ncbi:Adenine DNA glycosylase [Armadillidium vulgare]|nr:Adenine DNA glycosylase [Armadillidium vulgare]
MSKHVNNNSQNIGPLHLFKKEEVIKIRQLLLEWYDANHRVLPWRNIANTETDYDKRAYAVWVSEIMCQQTQVATVIDYYNKWMLQWPTVDKLADASLEEVNKTWAGLGYYSRAKRLHEGALKVTRNMNGKFPKGRDCIRKELPGVGRYTASAIASISSKEPVGVVDGNVFRVLSRIRAIGADISSQCVIEEMWKMSDELVDEDEPGDFNQALMELGALICTPKTPKCGSCPVKNLCVSYSLADKKAIGKFSENKRSKNCIVDLECRVQNFPRKSKKTLVKNKISAVIIVRKEAEVNVPQYLFIQRPKKGLLANLWEFVSVVVSHDNENEHNNTEEKPLMEIDETFIKKKLESSLKDDFKFPDKIIKNLKYVSEVTHIFSHIHQIYKVYEVTCHDSSIHISYPQNYQGVKWMSEEVFLVCATSTAMKKVFKAYKTSISNDSKTLKEKRKRSPSRRNVDEKQRKLSHFFKRLPKTES